MAVRVVMVTLATLYEIAGRFEHELLLDEGSTVLDAILELVKRIPRLREEMLDENDGIKEDIRVLVNGRPIDNSRVGSVPVSDGDKIVLIPPAGGGIGVLCAVL